MLIPVWMLISMAVIATVALLYLALVLRRALNELFFWRGAFVRLQDAATLLFDAAEDRAAAGATIDRQAYLTRYRRSLEMMSGHAREKKIDWVSEMDRDYYREHFGPEPDLTVDAAPQPERREVADPVVT